MQIEVEIQPHQKVILSDYNVVIIENEIGAIDLTHLFNEVDIAKGEGLWEKLKSYINSLNK